MFLSLSKSRYRAVVHNNFICLSKDVSPDVKLRYEADHCNKLPRQKKVSWPDVPSSYSFIFLHTITSQDLPIMFPNHPRVSPDNLRACPNHLRSPQHIPIAPYPSRTSPNCSRSPQSFQDHSRMSPNHPQKVFKLPQITSERPHFGTLWGALGLFWVDLEQSRNVMGVIRGLSRVIWGHSGMIWGQSGVIWVEVGHSGVIWGDFKTPWGDLGTNRGDLGRLGIF